MHDGGSVVVAEVARPGVDDLAAEGMQGQDGHVLGAIAELTGHLTPQPSGRLGGKAEDQDRSRVHPAFLDQEGHPAGERDRLAAAGPGDNRHEPVGGGDQLLLGGGVAVEGAHAGGWRAPRQPKRGSVSSCQRRK